MSNLFVVPSQLLSGDTVVSDCMGISDLNRCYELDSAQSGEWTLTESHRKDAPLGGPRLFSDNRWTVVFAGDLIDYETVPFAHLISALEKNRWDFLANLSGIFAFVAYERKTRRLFAVSDRRSQKPLFFKEDTQGLQVSTDLSVFARLPGELEFDKRWLWELLYFNFPVDSTTFLRDVKRCPPSSILSYDGRSGRVTLKSYAEIFKPRDPLLRGREALELATNVFSERVARHYDGASSAACALTDGWDGRTMLALAPTEKDVTAYTYGGSGCDDLENATATAKAIGADHLVIPFDQSFVNDLPHHAFETVYLSGGLQSVLRCTLHHAYNQLTDGGSRFPLTMSGIALGTELRGSAQFPDLVSLELAQRFQGLDPMRSEDSWHAIVGTDHRDFGEWVQSKLDLLESRFGPFESPEHHLAYVVYPGSTSYFCGELQLSEKFTTVRVPAWDTKVLDLLYTIENSTISFSHFAMKSQRVHRNELVLQAHLLCKLAPSFRSIPVRTNKPAAVLAGEIPYQLDRICNGIKQRVKFRSMSPKPPMLENWGAWLFDQNMMFVTDLLQSSDTLIGDFVEQSVVDSTIATRNMRLLGKLLTTEIILRLIKTRWQRFW